MNEFRTSSITPSLQEPFAQQQTGLGAYVAKSTTSFVQAPTTGHSTPTSYGQLVLPKGHTVHIVPSQQSPNSLHLPLVPSSFIFLSAINAMLQSQLQPSRDLESHITEPFRLRATKVTEVEWSKRDHSTSDNPNQNEQGPKNKKNKKRNPRRDDFFDGISFFHYMIKEINAEITLLKKLVIKSRQSSPTAKKLSSLRKNHSLS